MKIKLSQSEYDQLRQIQKHPSLPRREYRKVTVLIMLYQEHSVSSIEAALGLDDNTIRRYAKTYQEKGFAAFIVDGFIPYCGKLSEKQLVLLANHLDEYLYEDAAAICHYVKTTFGIVYSVSGITQLLHRIGFVYKQTKTVPSRANEQDQLDFLDDVLPALLEQAAQGEAVVYYADGVHPTHNTKSGRGWIRKGQDFEVDCNSGRKRVNINGAKGLSYKNLIFFNA